MCCALNKDNNHDRSDLIVWVFHMKVDEFIADIREGKTFGPIRAGQ